jgi:hypothetical protein
LGDAIAEVYGPSHKCQHVEDMIAEETVEQAEVVSGSSKSVETEQHMVQLTTSTPENNWSPSTESNLLESAPIIVDTVMTPTTGDQDGDNQSGGGIPALQLHQFQLPKMTVTILRSLTRL